MRKILLLSLLFAAVVAWGQAVVPADRLPVALGIVGTTSHCDSFTDNVRVERFENSVYLTIAGETLSPTTHIVVATPQWTEPEVLLRAGITPAGKVAITVRRPGGASPECIAFAFVVYRIWGKNP